jgi:hypothetical protein
VTRLRVIINLRLLLPLSLLLLLSLSLRLRLPFTLLFFVLILIIDVAFRLVTAIVIFLGGLRSGSSVQMQKFNDLKICTMEIKLSKKARFGA